MPLLVKIEWSTEFHYFVALQKLSSWPGTCWSLYITASLASLKEKRKIKKLF